MRGEYRRSKRIRSLHPFSALHRAGTAIARACAQLADLHTAAARALPGGAVMQCRGLHGSAPTASRHLPASSRRCSSLRRDAKVRLPLSRSRRVSRSRVSPFRSVPATVLCGCQKQVENNTCAFSHAVPCLGCCMWRSRQPCYFRANQAPDTAPACGGSFLRCVKCNGNDK